MSKKTILMCNEANFLSTGYAKYGKEVLKRLHATGKYNIYEFACYSHYIDQLNMDRYGATLADVPWGVYSNMPCTQAEMGEYTSKVTHQFGEWRFNDVVLDLKPDIVFDIRDHWMSSYEETCPFRNFYHWSYMPTVDASPQDEPWLATFMDADSIFAYSDWGLKVLQEEGFGRIKTVRSHPPGVDINNFVPVANKKEYKKQMGFNPDLFIVGTVMRNQKRKLYPELIKGFKTYLDKLLANNNLDLAKRSFLYLHTSYPDLGWDIPRLVLDNKLSHKVLFTYKCQNCGFVFPAFFQEGRTVCSRCNNKSATLPTTNAGVSEKDLAMVINLFDIYIQYANSEGFGMPQVEAGACGVPVASVDYSAMSDVVRKLKGYPIAVDRLYNESETHCLRALPNEESFVEILIKFANLPQSLKDKKGIETRKAVEKYYTWDQTAKMWENFFDSVDTSGKRQWDSPPQIFHPQTQIPGDLDNNEFVDWCFTHILGEPHKIGSYQYNKIIKDLNYGASLQGRGGLPLNDASLLALEPRWVPVSQQSVAEELLNIRSDKNYWEQVRCGMIKRQPPDFIRAAKRLN